MHDFEATDHVVRFLSVPAPHTFHIVQAEADGVVTGMRNIAESKVASTPGSSCSAGEIFDHLNPGEELVIEPFDA